jgi:hypothetical protein
VATWPTPDRLHARVRVHTASTKTWSERDVAFAAGDPELERGRALALTIVSMVPDTPRVPTPPPSAPPPHIAPSPRPIDVMKVPSPTRFQFEAAGTAASGATWSIGAGAATRLRLSDVVALRAGGLSRFGSIDAALAASSTWALDMGVAVTPLAFGPLRFGVRLDVGALHFGLRRARDDGGTTKDGRWLPFADLVAEGALRLGAGGSLTFGIGVEQAFGATDVLVDGVHVSSLASRRLVSELGARIDF